MPGMTAIQILRHIQWVRRNQTNGEYMKPRKWVIKKRRKKSFVKEERLRYTVEIYFEVICSLNKRVRITKNHWNKILSKHPTICGLEAEIKSALRQSVEIRLSQRDSSIYLYYNNFKNHLLCVVVRHINGEGYIVTSYITDSIKIGRVIWKK